MGCINSKNNAIAKSKPSFSPSLTAIDRSSFLSSRNPSGLLDHHVSNILRNSSSKRSSRRGKSNCDHDQIVIKEGTENQKVFYSKEMKKGGRSSSRRWTNLGVGDGGGGGVSFSNGSGKVAPSGPAHRHVGVEHAAAGWPSWLSSTAGEAIHGWVPLRADAFEKLEKIGQGTYSSVFRAREVESGRMVALKKVRFDNFQAESIRFMAREILILRRLDHPNIMKLDGIITSRLSSSIYLVFEYMEHDLAGLSSGPDISFSESQVKCYMKQLLLGIEHCHLRGVMHRDIKASNILVNNEGILKIGDFGLANILHARNRQQLTSRVVTLWYRPPELLMGSTSYGLSVDLWSVGCVFAELFIGKPLLKGRTEVEQLHKIFRLCGSPPDEYWKQNRLPNASMFRPQHPYESTLQERLKDFPKSAATLIETLLSVDPEKRGTATSALASEYFSTMPYACDPSSLPKYSPNKEMDAKCREEARRKKAGARTQNSAAARRPKKTHKLQEHSSLVNFVQQEDQKDIPELITKANYTEAYGNKRRAAMRRKLSSPFDTISESSHISKGDQIFTGPAPITLSSGFAWVKRRRAETASSLSFDQSSSSTGQSSVFDSSRLDVANDSLDSRRQVYGKHDHPTSNSFSTTATSEAVAPTSYRTTVQSNQRKTIELSGPLLAQSNKVEQWIRLDELLQRNENQIRLAARKTSLDREI